MAKKARANEGFLRPRNEVPCAGNTDPGKHSLTAHPLHWPIERCEKCGARWNPESGNWVAYVAVTRPSTARSPH